MFTILGKNVAVCILAGHFNFFCYRDKEWSLKTLEPLLTANNQKLFTNAWEGMVYFSHRINKDTADLITPMFFKAIKHIQWLEGEAKKGFIELLLTLMIYVIEKPTLKFIPEYYKHVATENRKDLIKIIERRLQNMDETNKLNWWNSWLKHFLENRKNNKPCELENEENQAIIELISQLPNMFGEAVDVICKGKMPQNVDGSFWYRLNDIHIAKHESHSMAKLLIKVLENVTGSSFYDDYICKIVGELTDLDQKERNELQEVFLKRNIDVTIA